MSVCVLQRNKTPLHSSCEHGHLNLTTLLLDRGANMILVDNVSHTYTHTHTHSRYEQLPRKYPLHVTCKEGHTLDKQPKAKHIPLGVNRTVTPLSLE